MTDKIEWVKLPPMDGRPNPCACCPPIASLLPMDARIAVGFGYAALLRDEEELWSERGQEWEDCPTLAQAEAQAAADPDHDWRIALCGPLHGEFYQRQGPSHWVLVDSNQGFA